MGPWGANKDAEHMGEVLRLSTCDNICGRFSGRWKIRGSKISLRYVVQTSRSTEFTLLMLVIPLRPCEQRQCVTMTKGAASR